MTHTTRRDFLQTSAALAGAGLYLGSNPATAARKPRSKNERLGIGAIGLRYQGSVIAVKAQLYGDVVAVCDVDGHVRDQAKASFGSTPRSYEDYRSLLQRKEVDVVTIGTPDHWHVKMAMDALRAGKDVYVEKPLSLTIDEGKRLRAVAKETGGIVQVGSWQRSDSRFRLAVELVRQGRLGELKQVDVVLGKNKVGGPFQPRPVPKHLNWDLWQGQTPETAFLEERCHYTFRWWYEYSGGQMTDWGAHHLDIAQWGIDSYPVHIDGRAEFPTQANAYNVATKFSASYQFANGVKLTVSDTGRNGIMFTGSKGRIFVNRGVVSGKPVEDLAQHPLPKEEFQCYGFDNWERPQRAGKLEAIINHMGNFFDCIHARKEPVSDVESQHRSVSTCHLGNISMRLGRPLQWDPEQEQFVNDDEANAWLQREQRSEYQVI